MRRSRHKHPGDTGQGQITNTVSIRERPALVEDRAVPGHSEGDLIMGTHNSQIATLVERHARYVMLAKVNGKDTETVINALIKQVHKLPRELYKSLTWDRLYSAYRYLKSGGWNEEDKAWAADNLGHFDSFDTFVKQWLSDDNIMKHRHFWPQSRFVCDDNNMILVDHIAYFETINDDYEAIRKLLGIGQQLGHHNINPGDDYRLVYDEESKKIVKNVYATDISLFEYDFDGIRERKILN